MLLYQQSLCLCSVMSYPFLIIIIIIKSENTCFLTALFQRNPGWHRERWSPDGDCDLWLQSADKRVSNVPLPCARPCRDRRRQHYLWPGFPRFFPPACALMLNMLFSVNSNFLPFFLKGNLSRGVCNSHFLPSCLPPLQRSSFLDPLLFSEWRGITLRKLRSLVLFLYLVWEKMYFEYKCLFDTCTRVQQGMWELLSEAAQ